MIVDPRPALRALVLSDSGVTAIAGQRMFPLRAPQGVTQPCIIYQRISSVPDHHLEGPVSVIEVRFQIAAWAQGMDTAVALSNAIKSKIDGFAGTVPYGDDSPQDEVNFKGIFCDNEFEDYDGDAKMFRHGRSYLIWYSERG